MEDRDRELVTLLLRMSAVVAALADQAGHSTARAEALAVVEALIAECFVRGYVPGPGAESAEPQKSALPS